MKTTFCFNLFIWSIISLLSVSCSKQNDALDLKQTGGFQEDMAVYPHPVAWKNKHMGYMADNKVESSCLQCHQSQLGKPLVVSCATQCHHSESENIPPKDAPTPTPNKCSICHADVTKNKYGHYPVNAGVCTTCHIVSDKHLAGEKDPATIKDTDNDCYRCHTRKDSEANVHTALKMSESSCVTCHDPHGGNQRFFLRDMSKDKDVTIKAMCTQCHSFDINEVANKHGAVESKKSCLNCHNPHSSKNSKQLKRPVQELCAKCHDTDSLLNKDDIETTDFRTSVKNLHWKHVVQELPGKSCRICHDPHGSKQEAFIDQSMITFSKVEHGGTCTFTCHDLKTYNRKEN